MILCAASPEHGALTPGSEHELPDEVAVRYVEAGAAVPVRAPAVERAVAPPAEAEEAAFTPDPTLKRGSNAPRRRKGAKG